MGFGHVPFGHYPFGHPSAMASQIQDIAFNPLIAPATGQMLGYVEPEPGESFGLDIYRFFISSIRKEDEKNTLFLKRFLEGPQAVWERTQAKIFDIKDLWDITAVEDDFLPYLQNIVGWTGDLSSITEALDNDTLRRLISVSSVLWKNRGPEDSMINVIQLTTRAQARIWNWFDIRWILDETQLGEDHQGRDPWIIDVPGGEYYSNLRIVDDGTLNKTLVEDLVKLMRASGERIEISYIDFMDLFTIKGDDAKWNNILGTLVIEDGTAELQDNTQEETALVDHEPATWSEYVLYGRVKGTSGGDLGLAFYQDATALNGYYAALDIAGNNIKLLKEVAGSLSTVTTVSFAPHGTLVANVYYGLRVHVAAESSTNRIKVYVDADEIINTTDSSHTSGTIGLWHNTGSILECDEIEMFTLPLDTDLVDINS